MFKIKTIRLFVLRSTLVTLALTAAAGEVYAKKKGNRPDDTGRLTSQTTNRTPPAVTQGENILTGCLHKEGQLRRFAEGEVPVKPCNPNEKMVQLQTAGTQGGVEPFALAFGEGETKVLAEEGGLQFSLTCIEGNALLKAAYAAGDTVLNAPLAFPISLSEPVADSTLPALLASDGSFLGIHGMHVAFNQFGAACIVTGILQRSHLDLP